MDIRTVTETFAVTGQPAPADMAALAAQGFSTVICNRPDGEEEGQPSSAEMGRAAHAAGLSFHYLPVTPGEFTDAGARAMAEIRKAAPGRVLGYCRSGARSVTLDAIGNPEGLGMDERIAAAKAAGYDIADKRGLLGD